MNDLRTEYTTRYNETLVSLSRRLEAFIVDHFSDLPRIDRISARAKGVERFLEKADKMDGDKRKYDAPLQQIQDQIGARIVTFYPDDVPLISKTVEEYFHPIEDRTVVPDSDSEFGYFGKHYILVLPKDVVVSTDPKTPTFFELQIKTLFQHAWSEANHDLGYKTCAKLNSNFRRRIAFTSAQAWGADQMFNELQREIAQQQ
jgi:putative GTP pyrophosphokinase